eukprot:CAMPEP_0174359604 /NCGR_PEP_ID=MMETSP0811_2-20130205/49620_1 /TAXON_ID=73025 ORGANISM="Eutreptiella gymnastica-like, Strain CCMP1594" /NCGR_SAMPLE_ID=MMETSP0811_2 /ASSEMBLY_ACC=CAM_ASM_000667 /LENGTH=44 /DNA_ID= /DNA_START= /DNA_END= /DNA_ORIENTATION=
MAHAGPSGLHCPHHPKWNRSSSTNPIKTRVPAMKRGSTAAKRLW